MEWEGVDEIHLVQASSRFRACHNCSCPLWGFDSVLVRAPSRVDCVTTVQSEYSGTRGIRAI